MAQPDFLQVGLTLGGAFLALELATNRNKPGTFGATLWQGIGGTVKGTIAGAAAGAGVIGNTSGGAQSGTGAPSTGGAGSGPPAPSGSAGSAGPGGVMGRLLLVTGGTYLYAAGTAPPAPNQYSRSYPGCGYVDASGNYINDGWAYTFYALNNGQFVGIQSGAHC